MILFLFELLAGLLAGPLLAPYRAVPLNGLNVLLAFAQGHILKFSIVGPDQQMVTERPSNWSPGLIWGAFCTIFRARPVGTGLGAKFGRKPAKNQMKIKILIT